MATQKGSGLVSRAVREALSTLVSPTLCEQLISRSLASQGLSAVPESGAEIGEWLEGPLRGEVETTVGPDAADLMMMQLGPIAAYAAISQPSGQRTDPPATAPKRAAGDMERRTRPTEELASIAHPHDEAQRARRSSDAERKRSTPPPADSTRANAASPSIDPDDRATDIRFDLTAEPDWTPAGVPSISTSPPAPTSSSAFASDPPTGTFSAPKVRVPPKPASSFLSRRNSEPPVRTLPPVKRISDVPPPPEAEPEPEGRVSRGLTARPAPIEEYGSDVPKGVPLVLTATKNRAALLALRKYLASAAGVVHVPDLVGLLDALEEPGVVEPIVLIDCHSPTVHISSVSAIGEDLPRGTTVVLWGVDDTTWAQIDRERSPACRWVRCSSEATTDDVGSLCSMLLG